MPQPRGASAPGGNRLAACALRLARCFRTNTRTSADSHKRRAGSVSSRRTARPPATRCFRAGGRGEGFRSGQEKSADSRKRRAPSFSSGRKDNSRRTSPVLPGLKSGARPTDVGLRRAPCARSFRSDGNTSLVLVRVIGSSIYRYRDSALGEAAISEPPTLVGGGGSRRSH